MGTTNQEEENTNFDRGSDIGKIILKMIEDQIKIRSRSLSPN
jgi:hypothetical protein